MPRPVLINSVPKSGTHLLASVLTELNLTKKDDLGLTALQRFRTKKQGILDFISPCKIQLDLDDAQSATSSFRCNSRLSFLHEGQFATAHVPFSPALEKALDRKKIACICIVRDPRAVLWSWYHHMIKFSDYPFHDDMVDSSSSLETKLMLPLLGRRKGKHIMAPLVDRYKRLLGWKKSDIGLWTRFEDLIGPQGGGNEASQIETISKISDFLGIKLRTEGVASSVFGNNSWTFRAGRVDDWRGNIPESISNYMKIEFRTIYEELGYDVEY